MKELAAANLDARWSAALPHSAFRKLPQLLRRGSLAITDQGLFSGANFLVNVLLARRLAPAEYGAFSLAYSAFLLLALLHQALLIEPMMIFGAGKYSRSFSRYLRLLIGIHAALLAPTALALCAAAAILGRVYFASTQSAFEGMALASAFILLFWLVRRVFYVVTKPAWGVISSCCYLAALAVLVGVLWLKGSLTPRSAFLAMGVASLLASAILLPRFVSLWKEGGQQPTLGEIIADHWRYGRWAAACALASWFPSNVYYVLLAAWFGLEGAGALRALTNFIMPVVQAIVAVNMLMLPALVRDRRDSGTRKMNQTMALFFALLGSGCAVYLSALWAFRGHLFQVFYGGRYSQYMGWPLLLAAALPLGTCAYSVLGNGLRAMERPDRMFWAFIGSSAAAALIGVPCTAKFGLTGALLGNHFSSVTFVIALWWIYRSLAGGRQPQIREVPDSGIIPS